MSNYAQIDVLKQAICVPTERNMRYKVFIQLNAKYSTRFHLYSNGSQWMVCILKCSTFCFM